MERIPDAFLVCDQELMVTSLILVGRNIYDKVEIEEAGFIYHCIVDKPDG